MKLAVADFERVLAECRPSQKIAEKIETLTQKWEARLAEVDAKLQEAQTRLSETTEQTPAELLFALSHEARLLDLESRQIRERAQTDLEGHTGHLQQSLVARLQAACQNLGKQRGIDMLLAKSNPQVPYVADAIDLTQVLLGVMNNT